MCASCSCEEQQKRKRHQWRRQSHGGDGGSVHARSRGLSAVVGGSGTSSGLLGHDGVGGELGDLKDNVTVVVGGQVQGLLGAVVVLDIDGNLGAGVSLAKGEGDGQRVGLGNDTNLGLGDLEGSDHVGVGRGALGDLGGGLDLDAGVVDAGGHVVGAGGGGVGRARGGESSHGQSQGKSENAQSCHESLLHVRYSSTCSLRNFKCLVV